MSSPLPPFKAKHLSRCSKLPNYAQTILPLLQHASHVALHLPVLMSRLEAMSGAFEVLVSDLSRLVSSSPNLPLASLRSLLTHFFVYYVRVSDSLTLIQSGEIRHPKEPRPRFESRLKECGVRRDGYTRMYKGERYSGVSYDEWANETVGLSTLLSSSLSSHPSLSSKLLAPVHSVMDGVQERQNLVSSLLKSLVSRLSAAVLGSAFCGGGARGTFKVTAL
eukprot:CAMPEP_0182471596 /NCGR_PEP_ID=MMETSP1319-20130603/20625_1 /TAXON_ID=172717 /ORGANISM="Bolidomonas pacifica, Strain RCC208" /LENGTH=220 /DNA_ID=CAMNT_0024672165 /DNA_START=253 /DNA_END=912 /DNA_ORIENTATION=+